jgi:hypothetical protein
MKKTFHLCFSAGDEALFRDLEDYHRGFNCFALALYKTDSTGLAESFMSTHTHQLVQTACPRELMIAFRQSYAQYFNHKYRRKGKLGENMHFELEVVGYHHNIAALTYVLRNALHHGVVPIPYAYPHCSVNAIFREAMGRFQPCPILPANQCYKYIGRRALFPETYKMTESGVFLRESVLDIPQVENLFVTPRAFNYYMSRKSSEEWEKEQSKDGNGLSPISLPAIEQGVNMHSLEKMLAYENGKADYRKMSDIELCTYLDQVARTRYGKHSVYHLTLSEKVELAEELFRAYHMNETRIRRGLAFFD